MNFELIQLYWVEFFTIALVHLLAVASPGPDFAIVTRYSVSYGRRAAILASLGIGLGILIHVAYSLLGIGLLIKTYPAIYKGMTIIAALYLFYLGFQAIKNARPSKSSVTVENNHISDKTAFFTGLMTNGLNPKATLFFISVFAVVVSVQTPYEIRLLYGIYMAIATGCWFVMLSYFLSAETVRGRLNQYGFWFDRLMGLILVILAINLLLPELL